MIKSYAKQEWFLPKTLADANIQLTTCRRFLEKLTCRGSIPVQGYARGEELLGKYAQIFERAILADSLYLVKFLHLLDTIFQSFLKEFVRYMNEDQPVRQARHKLRHFMTDWEDRIMRDLEISQRPQLELPPALEEVAGSKPAASARKRRTEDESTPGPTSKQRTVKTTEEHYKNPEAVPDYFKRPELRKFSDAWNRNALTMLPKARHHASGREVSLCARYQAEGQCRAKCPYANVLPSQLTESQQKQAKLACRKAYE
jgi:hypothetical protein